MVLLSFPLAHRFALGFPVQVAVVHRFPLPLSSCPVSVLGSDLRRSRLLPLQNRRHSPKLLCCSDFGDLSVLEPLGHQYDGGVACRHVHGGTLKASLDVSLEDTGVVNSFFWEKVNR